MYQAQTSFSSSSSSRPRIVTRKLFWKSDNDLRDLVAACVPLDPGTPIDCQSILPAQANFLKIEDTYIWQPIELTSAK